MILAQEEGCPLLRRSLPAIMYALPLAAKPVGKFMPIRVAMAVRLGVKALQGWCNPLTDGALEVLRQEKSEAGYTPV